MSIVKAASYFHRPCTAIAARLGAEFSFDTLLVNGEPMKAQTAKEPLGRTTSWVRVTVGASDTVDVEIPKTTAQILRPQ